MRYKVQNSSARPITLGGHMINCDDIPVTLELQGMDVQVAKTLQRFGLKITPIEPKEPKKPVRVKKEKVELEITKVDIPKRKKT